MLNFGDKKIHWNYFLALERDLENISRYIEFSNDNMDTYSIELARILMSATQEIDVIMKQYCTRLDSTRKASKIHDYQTIILDKAPIFFEEEVFVHRFGLSYKPWKTWTKTMPPDWWTSNNKIKHDRYNQFKQANLKNAINAVGALFLSNIALYITEFPNKTIKDITSEFSSNTKLISLKDSSYYQNWVC